MTYEPTPIDTSGIELSPAIRELTERLAASAHDQWSRKRLAEGWKYGPKRSDDLKENPCLVPYEQLPDSEKEYDRSMAMETLKAILALGYRIEPGAAPADAAHRAQEPVASSTGKPFGLAVKALVADDQDRVLLIRRSPKSKSFASQWDLPGGKADPGEAFDVAMAREAFEETGLTIDVTGVAGAYEYEMPRVRAVILFLEARRVAGGVRLSDEHDAHQWVSRADLTSVDIADQLREFVGNYRRR
jgi:ryanodine receptor 2